MGRRTSATLTRCSGRRRCGHALPPPRPHRHDVSVVGVGTWQFGGEWGVSFDQPAVDAIFDAARECGINLVDTAECYGDHLSESFVGAALAARPSGLVHRDEVRAPVSQAVRAHRSRGRRATCSSSASGRCAALRTDYIDVYQYHSWGDDGFFADDVLAVLHTLKDEGKIRTIGNSVGSNVNVKQVEASTARKVESIQIIYNRLAREPETTTFPIAQPATPRRVGARAVGERISHAANTSPATRSLRTTRAAGRRRTIGRRSCARPSEIAKTEVPAGVDMASWALAWCLQSPVVSAVIPGCKDAEQVRKNAAAVSLIAV